MNEKEAMEPRNLDSHMAWIGMWLSAERSLQSWVRTSVSLIAFGFTIVQFFERLDQMENVAPGKYPHLPRFVGLMLIAIGTAAMVIAIWQYESLLKYLNDPQFSAISGVKGMRRWYANVAVAIVLCLVGLATFTSILLRTIAR
jgi:putative membrane protein